MGGCVSGVRGGVAVDTCLAKSGVPGDHPRRRKTYKPEVRCRCCTSRPSPSSASTSALALRRLARRLWSAVGGGRCRSPHLRAPTGPAPLPTRSQPPAAIHPVPLGPCSSCRHSRPAYVSAIGAQLGEGDLFPPTSQRRKNSRPSGAATSKAEVQEWQQSECHARGSRARETATSWWARRCHGAHAPPGPTASVSFLSRPQPDRLRAFRTIGFICKDAPLVDSMSVGGSMSLSSLGSFFSEEEEEAERQQ